MTVSDTAVKAVATCRMLLWVVGLMYAAVHRVGLLESGNDVFPDERLCHRLDEPGRYELRARKATTTGVSRAGGTAAAPTTAGSARDVSAPDSGQQQPLRRSVRPRALPPQVQALTELHPDGLDDEDVMDEGGQWV